MWGPLQEIIVNCPWTRKERAYVWPGAYLEQVNIWFNKSLMKKTIRIWLPRSCIIGSFYWSKWGKKKYRKERKGKENEIENEKERKKEVRTECRVYWKRKRNAGKKELYKGN